METNFHAAQTEERLYLCTSAVHKISAGIAIIDSEGLVWFWNHWLAEKSGLSVENAIGKNLLELFPELIDSRLARAIDDALKRGLASLLSQSLHKSPLPLFEHLSATALPAAERLQQAIQVTPLECKNRVRFCLVQINDVSIAVKKERLLREQAEALRGLAYIDSLTGIPNRRRLDEYLGIEFKRAKRNYTPLSIIMADIDYFKQYNDTYNHSSGDFCLQRVANAIKATLRRPADLVARYGGEEFAIILPDTDEYAAATLAENIRKHIENLSIQHDGSKVSKHITISLGVSGVPPDAQIPADELLNRADIALYQAKGDGRNRVAKYQPQRSKIT